MAPVPKEGETEMSLTKAYREWRNYRQTINELSRMSDHELRDIGVRRNAIPYVARYGIR